MAFKKGKSGNPRGRPIGAVSKRLQLSRLLQPHAPELVQLLIDRAKNGDAQALRLCIERLLPKPRDEPVQFSCPSAELDNVQSLLTLGENIMHAVAAGALTPTEGQKITAIIEVQRKTLEACSLEARMQEIEHVLKLRSESRNEQNRRKTL